MSSIKSNTDEDSTRLSKDNVLLRCGECLHFEGSPHPGIGQACSLIGVKRYATAPSCYTPNVHVFRKTSKETLSLLASIVSGFTPQQSLVLMGLLKEQTRLKKKLGVSFLERVFFCVGEDYLENYVGGLALGMDPLGNLLIVGTEFLNDQRNPIVASMGASSILTYDAFIKKRDQLLSRGLIYQPRKRNREQLPDCLKDYEPPTIETPQDFLESVSSKKRARTKAEVLEIRGTMTYTEDRSDD